MMDIGSSHYYVLRIWNLREAKIIQLASIDVTLLDNPFEPQRVFSAQQKKNNIVKMITLLFYTY